MHVGMSVICQGLDGPSQDREVFRREVALADMAEPMGLDSIWTVEHHFTDYTMSPNPIQFLSYMAGRTKRVKLGTMVVVLPWHHAPMRVAEEVALIDHLSDGRFIFGIGRGLGRIEFEGFGINQSDSRAIFIESAQMVLAGLESGYCEFDGEHVKQVRRAIRPSPFKTFRGRTYASAVSPESSQIMARLGVGLIIVPQKPWDVVIKEVEDYRETYREVNHCEAPPPMVAGWSYVDEDPVKAQELGFEYLSTYYDSVLSHYELNGDHLKNIKGYETHAKMQQQHAEEGGPQKMVNTFVNLHPFGTPSQVIEKMRDIQQMLGADGFIANFSFGGMDQATAQGNMQTFCDKVMPTVRNFTENSLLHNAAE